MRIYEEESFISGGGAHPLHPPPRSTPTLVLARKHNHFFLFRNQLFPPSLCVILGSPPSSTSPYMSPREQSKKDQGIQESPACEKTQSLSLQKSIPTLMLVSSPSSTSPYMSLREESKKDQDIQESPACREGQFLQFSPEINSHPTRDT